MVLGKKKIVHATEHKEQSIEKQVQMSTEGYIKTH